MDEQIPVTVHVEPDKLEEIAYADGFVAVIEHYENLEEL